ncbi:DNA-binding transcriptional regulator GbsR (MarR family) [Virgibacillus natechei]|uniref:HTH-type transcriptional regulator n=1 Tax=Virgibacillus natechei TaxID=1216297 RepID=A0ABS4IDG5_9BACI|nr:helix-turn-helix domain-containing protein [Virgibacillus natechei]MBP1968980.1 DNA-binding transcriptional regulator GbsR (MarR family) [Virgibacillus natechei]UZD14257.1 transcriptional regulator [Virgibacillus natechei]
MNIPSNEDIKNNLMIEFSKTIENFDLSSVEARLFAYLYLSEKPLTLDEMGEAIGKSKTSMSTSVRTLADLNLVTRVWKKGVRKDLYQANNQLFKTFMNSYITKWIDTTNRQKGALEESKSLIHQKKKEESSGELVQLDKSLNDILEFHSLVEELFRDMKQE